MSKPYDTETKDRITAYLALRAKLVPAADVADISAAALTELIGQTVVDALMPVREQLGQEPLDAQLLLALGNAVYDVERDAEHAELLVQQAIARGSVEAQSDLGVIYFREGRLYEAEVAYETARDAGSRLAAWNLLSLMRSWGRIDEAISEAAALIERGDQEARLELGSMLEARDNFSGAESQYRAAFDAGVPRAAAYLGHLLWIMGRERLAEDVFRSGLSTGDESVLFDYALMLSEQHGREREAIDLYRRTDDPEAHLNLAMLFWKLGEKANAEREFEHAISLGDQDAVAAYAEFQAESGDAAHAFDTKRSTV